MCVVNSQRSFSSQKMVSNVRIKAFWDKKSSLGLSNSILIFTLKPVQQFVKKVPMVLNPNGIEPTFLKLGLWSPGAGFIPI